MVGEFVYMCDGGCHRVRGYACVWSYGDMVICLRHIYKNPMMYVSVTMYI